MIKKEKTLLHRKIQILQLKRSFCKTFLTLVLVVTAFLLSLLEVSHCDESGSYEEDEYYNLWEESSEEYEYEGEYWGSYKGLTEIPKNIPENTRVLGLAGNRLTELKVGDLPHPPSCTYIDFSGNDISRIEPGSFVGLDGLTELNLRYNKLTTFVPGTWRGIEQLTRLHL